MNCLYCNKELVYSDKLIICEPLGHVFILKNKFWILTIGLAKFTNTDIKNFPKDMTKIVNDIFKNYVFISNCDMINGKSIEEVEKIYNKLRAFK